MSFSRRNQSGYLVEIPLLMVGVGILLAILVPGLPVMLGKVLVSVGAIVWIGGLFYMLVVPGWHAGSTPRLRKPWNLIVFLALSATICLAAARYLLLL